MSTTRITLGRVLEDLRELRDPTPLPRAKLAPSGNRVRVIRDVMHASGLGLRDAKWACEESEWDTARAVAMARERSKGA